MAVGANITFCQQCVHVTSQKKETEAFLVSTNMPVLFNKGLNSTKRSRHSQVPFIGNPPPPKQKKQKKQLKHGNIMYLCAF